MEQGLGNHVDLFPVPNPLLPVFSAQIVATDKAQVLAGQGGMGMIAARDVQLGLLVGMMGSELTYIQSVADAGNPDEAVATLLAGGVEIAALPQRTKPALAVTRGTAPGSVVLVANAGALLGDNRGRKHFFTWEYTTDGKTFVAMPPTPESVTTMVGLTPLTTVGFRVAAATTKGVTTAWSPVVSLVIL